MSQYLKKDNAEKYKEKNTSETSRLRTLFDKKDKDLIEALETVYYGKIHLGMLSYKDGAVFFKPKTPEDHIATPQITIDHEDRKTTWIKITFVFSEYNHESTNFILDVQDENNATIYKYLYPIKKQNDESIHTKKIFVMNHEISNKTSSIRFVFFAKNKTPTYMPNTIKVEQSDKVISQKTNNDSISEKTLDLKGAEFLSFVKISTIEQREEIERFSLDVIDTTLEDLWVKNHFKNIWEYVTGQTVLTTYPWNVTLPISDLCNAKCPFCNAWFRGERYLKPVELDRFASVLKYSKLFGLQGHGEPLFNPQIVEILEKLKNILDERCRSYIITNGHLLKKYLKPLIEANIQVFNISLNAATLETHQKIMGLGKKSFENISSLIKKLIKLRDSTKPEIEVNISFLVIQQNIHELAKFIELGNNLGVNSIQIRALSPVQILTPDTGLNYQTLPPYLHPGFDEYVKTARVAIERSTVKVEASPDSWSKPIFPDKLWEELINNPRPLVSAKEVLNDPEIKPYYQTTHIEKTKGEKSDKPPLDNNDTDNPYNRSPAYRCKYVYQDLILTDFTFRLYPCCYMFDIPGYKPMVYDGTFDFFEVWNSPAMVKLRETLKEGPLFGACKTCPPQ